MRGLVGIASAALATIGCGTLLTVSDDERAAASDAGLSADAAPDAIETTAAEGGATSGACAPGAFFCDDFERPDISGGPIAWAVTQDPAATLRVATGGLEVVLPEGAESRARLDYDLVLPAGRQALTVAIEFTFTADVTNVNAAGYTDLLLVLFDGVGTWANLALGNESKPDVNLGPDQTIGIGAAPGVRHDLRYTVRFGSDVADVELDGKRTTHPSTYPALTSSTTATVLLGAAQHDQRGLTKVRYERIAITTTPL